MLRPDQPVACGDRAAIDSTAGVSLGGLLS